MAKEKTAPVAESATRRFVVLAPGQASPQMIPVAKAGQPGLSGLYLRTNEPHIVVSDDSTEEGVSETLAESLTDRGLCVYVEFATGGLMPRRQPAIVGDNTGGTEVITFPGNPPGPLAA